MINKKAHHVYSREEQTRALKKIEKYEKRLEKFKKELQKVCQHENLIIHSNPHIKTFEIHFCNKCGYKRKVRK